MAIDEKYLDDLLKSITENEDEPRTMDDAMREMASLSEAEVDGANENWANDLDDFFSQPQDLGYEDSVALDDTRFGRKCEFGRNGAFKGDCGGRV